MGITEEFMGRTKMLDIHNKTTGVERVMEYLTQPEIVDRMIIASEMDLPVLTLIGKGLENKFSENSDFPLVVVGNNKNATNRQNVGRMIKFIMAQYGYTPVDGGLSERARIPAISEAKYFSTSGIYKKTVEAKYVIRITTEEV